MNLDFYVKLLLKLTFILMRLSADLMLMSAVAENGRDIWNQE